MFENSLKLPLHIPKWFNAFHVFTSFSFLLSVTCTCTYVALYLIVLIVQLTPSSWRQKIVLLVFPVILQSAGSGFLTNQENARVRGVTKSYVICYTRPFLRSSSSCEQLLYSRFVEFFSGKFSLSIYLLFIKLALCLFTFLLWHKCLPYFILSALVTATQHSYTPRLSSGSFFFIHRFTWLHWTQP